jgi:hypothetical protein
MMPKLGENLMPKYFTQLKARWFSPEHPAAGPNQRMLDFVQMLY